MRTREGTAAAAAKTQSKAATKQNEHLTNAVLAISIIYCALVAFLLARLTLLRDAAGVAPAAIASSSREGVYE